MWTILNMQLVKSVSEGQHNCYIQVRTYFTSLKKIEDTYAGKKGKKKLSISHVNI